MAPASADDRLPLPPIVNWPNFPFEGDLRVRGVDTPAATEEPRSGDPGGAACLACGAGDDEYIWITDRWRLKTLAPMSPLPLSLILETRAHLDLPEFDDGLADDLGRLTVAITRLGESRPEIGRVHTNRWGDGARHFHVWFLGRPFGASQLKGLTLPLWGLTLPPLDVAVTDRVLESVVHGLNELAH